MVHAEKTQLGGTPYLNKKIVLEKKVTKIIVLNEAVLVDTEFEGKKDKRFECLASTNVLDPSQVRWQMNPTTANYMIDKYGPETKGWIGKEIDIAVKQAGSASPGVYPKDCSLEKVLV